MGSALIAVLMLATAAAQQEALIDKDLHVQEVVRDLDLSSQLVRESVKFDIENTGKAPLNYFIFALRRGEAKNVAFIQGSVVEKAEEKGKLKAEKASVKGLKNDDVFYKVDFKQPVAPSQRCKLQVDVLYSHALEPFPSHIAQADQQLVVYKGNVHVLSPYPVKKEKTTVKLSPGTVQSYTKETPTKQEGETITYGPYENIDPFSYVCTLKHYQRFCTPPRPSNFAPEARNLDGSGTRRFTQI